MKLHYGDLTDSTCLVKIINQVKPTEIYNLGAQSHVKVTRVSSAWPGRTLTLAPLEFVFLQGVCESVIVCGLFTCESGHVGLCASIDDYYLFFLYLCVFILPLESGCPPVFAWFFLVTVRHLSRR